MTASHDATKRKGLNMLGLPCKRLEKRQTALNPLFYRILDVREGRAAGNLGIEDLRIG